MGYYINPPTLTKEAWLDQHGKQLDKAPEWDEVPFDSLPVCLVDNGMFTAAGIAFDKGEFEAFTYPDRRRKIWFIVPKEKILSVEPSIKHLIKLPKKED